MQTTIQPWVLRAPEVFMGGLWGTSVDVRNFGCVVSFQHPPQSVQCLTYGFLGTGIRMDSREPIIQ